MSNPDSAGDNLKHLTLDISPADLENAFRFNVVSAGCFGAVYKVLHDGVLCAAKYRRIDESVYRLEHFQQECLLHSKLHHPNIVRMLGVCYHRGYHNSIDKPIKIMELLELDLFSVVHYKFNIPMYVKLTIIQDISRGLEYLHTRNPPIVHSYLTMDVVLLTANLVAKIGGFTFAVEMVSESKTLLESTVHSVNDEILKCSLYCGPPFDIYSFGGLICKTITEQQFYVSHKGLADNPIGKVLLVHAVDIDQYKCYIDLIKDVSLKQLVIDSMDDNPKLRPSALMINKIIGNTIKGEFYSPCMSITNNILLT